MPDKNGSWPIIYVRGYAMNEGEIDETTSDPFCGFNVGSTVMRAKPDKKAPPQKFIFESPIIRLQSEYGYKDVYENGVDIVDPDWEGLISKQSIIIYRYYDPASTFLGSGKTPGIKDFAKGLSKLILRVKELTRDEDGRIDPEEFRCYLVAHSMGGLVCRAFLQNKKLGTQEARDCVDKFFTYATPHNGIDMAGINVPEWLGWNDMDNFNRKEMASYLDIEDLYKKTKRVDWMQEEVFPSEKTFCMVATNRSDYEVAAGISRTFAGHGSDGLVRIENASVWGVNGNGEFSAPSATAYAYRSHSGRYGIVNCEESYQNLVRFLFGNVRVDVWVDVEEVRVPQELEQDDAKGRVDALYQFEVAISPRGKRWSLTRRMAVEDSVACQSHLKLKKPTNKNDRSIYLSTVFLSNKYKVNEKRDTLAYALRLGVRAPDYEVNKKFWPDRHYEGQYLFEDAVAIELKPPATDNESWDVTYDWQSKNVGQSSTRKIDLTQLKNGKVELAIPFNTGDETPPRSPGIAGRLRFVLGKWN